MKGDYYLDFMYLAGWIFMLYGLWDLNSYFQSEPILQDTLIRDVLFSVGGLVMIVLIRSWTIGDNIKAIRKDLESNNILKEEISYDPLQAYMVELFRKEPRKQKKKVEPTDSQKIRWFWLIFIVTTLITIAYIMTASHTILMGLGWIGDLPEEPRAMIMVGFLCFAFAFVNLRVMLRSFLSICKLKGVYI